jgi:hypothetical protein
MRGAAALTAAVLAAFGLTGSASRGHSNASSPFRVVSTTASGACLTATRDEVFWDGGCSVAGLKISTPGIEVQQLGSGGLLVSVVDDVDHVPVWIAHEEPTDAPRFIGQRMNDLVAAALRFRVGLVDVAPDVH